MMADIGSVLIARYPALLDCVDSPIFNDGDGVSYYSPAHWPLDVPAPTVEQVEAWILEDGD